MKISKIAIAALFAAGFVTASASAGFAEDEPKPQIAIDCMEGYSAVYSEDGTSGSCEPVSDGFDEDEPKPQIAIDCMEGYSAVYSEDGTSGSCEPVSEEYTCEPVSEEYTCEPVS
ncbi:MAG: hypothetical protein ACOYKO_03110, partial [Rhodoluna sp.]